MQRQSLVDAFGISFSLHLLLVLALQLTLRPQPPWVPLAPLEIELRQELIGNGGAVEAAPPPPKAEPPARVARRPAPAPPKVRRPTTIGGVRVATEEDVRARVERLDQLAAIEAPPPVEPSEPPALELPPAPPVAPPEPAAAASAQLPGAAAPASSGAPAAATGSGVAGFPPGTIVRTYIVRPYDDKYRPDTPGYYGRIFGQVSVRGASENSFHGRIHLFRDDGLYRDYSEQSLFGHSFRQELGNGAVREFQTGRVQTYGAYLMVTDLFSNGRISTMSHTVILAFPRRPPAGRMLYDVVNEPSGDFRLRGPAGSSLVFDGHDGALRAASGFDVAPPAGTGTPPRVRFRGLYVRVQAVGANPFLRGRAATVVDSRGRECTLTTSDLFVYPGRRRESDMFRFRSDREFFRFLGKRCPSLDLPRPAPELQMAKRNGGESAEEEFMEGGGLLRSILRGWRR